MTRTSRFTVITLLLATALGYVYYRGQVRQAAVLARLASVETRLTASNEQAAQVAGNIVHNISYWVCRNRNQVRDVAVLQLSQRILNRTQTLVDTLHQLRQQLPTTNSSSATALAAHLDHYTLFINQFAAEARSLTQFPADAVPGGWAGLDGLAPAAARASLTQLEGQLRRYEALALNQQAAKEGSSLIVFESIGVLAVPVSNTVAPGAVYAAQLVLTNSGINYCLPRMSADGKVLTVRHDGHGVFEFKVPASGRPDTICKRWHGVVQAQSCANDTTWQVDVPYFIVPPHAQ